MTTTTVALVAPDLRETIDFERIDSLIAWAEAEYEKKLAGLPSEWDQDNWVVTLDADGFQRSYGVKIDKPCGTVCCLAGRVGLEDEALQRISRTDEHGREVEMFSMSTIYVDPDAYYEGTHLEVGDYAGRVLGLRYGASSELFYGRNGLGDLKRIRDDYAARNGVPTRYTHEEYLVDCKADRDAADLY